MEVWLPGVLTGAGKTARLALVAGCAIVAAGCAGSGDGVASTPSVEVAEHWRLQMDQVLAGDPDEFTQQVLADHRITDAEYAEARQRQRACIEEAGPGLEAALSPGGGVDVGLSAEFADQFDSEAAALDGLQRIVDECAALPSSYIESIYIGMQQNPRGLAIPEMIRGCFEANAVGDGAGLPDDEFATFVLDESYTPSSEAAASCRENYLEPWDDRGDAGSS